MEVISVYLEDLSVFHQHLVSRDAVFFETQISVIVSIQAHFGSDLTDDNA